jgi:hypothetical protein
MLRRREQDCPEDSVPADWMYDPCCGHQKIRLTIVQRSTSSSRHFGLDDFGAAAVETSVLVRIIGGN